MSEVRIIVDHLKLEYKGPFDLNNFFRTVDAWLVERSMEKRVNKNFEHTTATGKQIEWEIASWKKITDYIRYVFKLRALMYDLNKVEAVKGKEKLKLTDGRVLLYFDGYLETDYEHRWDEKPFLLFLRTLYDKFLYKVYTEMFEQRITFDMHHLYNTVEKHFNMYKHYRPVARMPHFAH